jgi:hypothetical protein
MSTERMTGRATVGRCQKGKKRGQRAAVRCRQEVAEGDSGRGVKGPVAAALAGALHYSGCYCYCYCYCYSSGLLTER